jgi:polyisoprenoid-binding protein YceI
MPLHSALRTASAALLLAAAAAATQVALAQTKAPLAIDTARVSIAGTSNIHEYTASTTKVRVTRAVVAPAVAPLVGGPAFWDEIVKPGAIEALDIVVAAGTLSSPKEGLDKNMHKALKVEQFPEIAFRLTRLEPAAGGLTALGKLRIAGVERDVALLLTTERRDNTLVVKGKLPLLMTDYGIKPPTALLGMLKTDPKVTVTFETVLAVPLT